MTLAARFEQIVRADPDLMRLLECLRSLSLPQWRVVSGCLYQTVWNILTRRQRGTGLQDFDVVYFDQRDLSWDAEDAVIRRVTQAMTGVSAPIQVRNQARVHLWYEGHFGVPYTPLGSTDEALLRYPATVQAVGVRLETDRRLDIAAPFGLADIFGMIVRPNPFGHGRSSFDAKAARARAVWPEAIVAAAAAE